MWTFELNSLQVSSRNELYINMGTRVRGCLTHAS